MSRTGTERGACPNCGSSFTDCVTRTREPRRCCGPCLRFETVHPEVHSADEALYKIIERESAREGYGVMTVDLVTETGLPRAWVEDSVQRLRDEGRIKPDLGWRVVGNGALEHSQEELAQALYTEFGADAEWSAASADEQREFRQAALNLRKSTPHLFR